VISYWLSK